MQRGSGILLPIFSLPGRRGIGSFGQEAKNFVGFLARAKQKYWQLLPLNPTSYGDSPYQSFSAFALNPYFIDLDILKKQDLLQELPEIADTAIDYGNLYLERFKTLRTAYHNFVKKQRLTELASFIEKEKSWLIDYAAFMVIKKLEGGQSWQEWGEEHRFYSAALVEKIKEEFSDEFYFYVFLQYQAFAQYHDLKSYAAARGVNLIGDIPIYVALDSADVWSDPDSFQLDSSRRPIKVAGVPPDYFSVTGQLWGNPIYDYRQMSTDGFAWWKKRIKKCAELFDVLRIDHFRGIDEYWAVPASETTAINGEWIKGPGIKLIEALTEAAPKMQFIAEDLGLLTPSVVELKNKSGWPGMKILEFAFDGGYDNAFLPHNFEKNCVAYIGTHDNDTLANFLITNPGQHPFMKEYLKIDQQKDIHDTLIGVLVRSAADVVILCLQDLLKQGAEGRINIPGTLGGNWTYRLDAKTLTSELAEHLKKMTEEAGR